MNYKYFVENMKENDYTCDSEAVYVEIPNKEQNESNNQVEIEEVTIDEK